MKAQIYGFALLAMLAVAPLPAAAGNATPLTDAELDAVSGQGLLVVNLSFALSRIADRFDFRFTAQTTIQSADLPRSGGFGYADVAFLGGLLSISTLPDSRAPATPTTVGAAVLAANAGRVLAPTVVSITAHQAVVHTQANLLLSASDTAQSVRASLIRNIPRTLVGR